jgi:hypothetical protein
MPIFLTYHPWPGGTMSRDDMLEMVRGCYHDWQAQGIQWYSYAGTHENGEGWCLFSAPDRAALLRTFHEQRIPYLFVTEVWRLSEDDLDLTHTAEMTSPRVI